MKRAVIILGFILSLGIVVSLSFYASAESLIPSWIKNTAGFWVDDQISDSEFIAALQFLVKEGILMIPQPVEEKQEQQSGFSNTNCRKDLTGFVTMTGKFTNGQTPASQIYFILGVLDADGAVLATGIGVISNVEAYQTKLFEATAAYTGPFTKCEIQVSDVFR
ncbi:MAG: hypothetical protein IIA82_08405 [Thaumarchaeota archaeon]|nr:hypothetical protein [Nitrososphaerota archaeon]